MAIGACASGAEDVVAELVRRIVNHTRAQAGALTMTSVFQKLNLKAQTEIVLFNAPTSFEPELAKLQSVKIIRNPKKPASVQFALGFTQQQAELDRLSRLLAAHSSGDVVLWFAYPKGTSKRLVCEFNRDNGWHVIRKAGFDSVRQVAIDEDWSALRFRRLEYIKDSVR
jgi:hypothetical protein